MGTFCTSNHRLSHWRTRRDSKPPRSEVGGQSTLSSTGGPHSALGRNTGSRPESEEGVGGAEGGRVPLTTRRTRAGPRGQGFPVGAETPKPGRRSLRGTRPPGVGGGFGSQQAGPRLWAVVGAGGQPPAVPGPCPSAVCCLRGWNTLLNGKGCGPDGSLLSVQPPPARTQEGAGPRPRALTAPTALASGPSGRTLGVHGQRDGNAETCVLETPGHAPTKRPHSGAGGKEGFCSQRE